MDSVPMIGTVVIRENDMDDKTKSRGSRRLPTTDIFNIIYEDAVFHPMISHHPIHHRNPDSRTYFDTEFLEYYRTFQYNQVQIPRTCI